MHEPKIILILDTLSAAAEEALALNPLPDDIGKPQFRRMQAAVGKGGYDPETRTVTATISSEFPVDRWGGVEILQHGKENIDASRLDRGISHLYNHDWNILLGRTESYAIKDRKLAVTSKLASNDDALKREKDIADGSLPDVSLGYMNQKVEVTEDKNGNRTYNVTRWMPYEWSSVTVPADFTVGVNRSVPEIHEVEVRFRKLDTETPPTAPVTRSASDDDEEEDDEDGDPEDPDTPEAGERTAAAPATSTPTEPIQQRTQTMATAAVVADPSAENKVRTDGLRALRSEYPAHYTEEQLLNDIFGTRSVNDTRTAIADSIIKKAETSTVPTAAERLFGAMSERERSSYSLRNVYARAINERMPGTYRDKAAEAGFEREISQELRKDAETRGITDMGGGTLVPSASSRVFAPQLLQERTIASGGNAGAATNFTTVSTEIIELLRYRTTLLAMGARYMGGMHGAFQMPSQTGAATSSWLLEGGTIASTDPTLGSFTVQPKRMSIANSYYRDFLAQSGLAVDAFLANDRMNVTARSLNAAGLAGTGVLPIPQGIFNRTGLASVLSGTTKNTSTGAVTAGAGGVPMTYMDYNNMEAIIATANGDIGTMGIITTPRVRASGRTTQKQPGVASDFIWPDSPISAQGIQEGPLGYKSIVSADPVLTGFTANSVSGLHAVLMGVFDQCGFCDWDLSEIVVDPYTGASSAMVKITEHAWYDFFVRQLPAFCVCTSALPQ